MMRELRLIFEAQKDGSFTVRLEAGFEGGSRKPVGTVASLRPFLSDEDFEDLRWYLEEYMDLPDGGAAVRAHGVEQKIDEWGRRLYRDVFSTKDNATLLGDLLAVPEPRELTIATDHPVLLRLPWELMADSAGSLAHRVAIRRQLAEPKALVPREVQLPLRMLYVVSRPSDTGFIDPRLTTRALLAAIDPLQGNVRLDFCRPPTLARMEEMLREAESAGDTYDVVHFDGHGTFMPEAQIGALCFEKPDDGTGPSRTDFVRADRLGDLLAKYKIPLVVLEACRSGTIGRAAVFRSVAPRLISAGVGSVLSMGHAVHVEAARLLLDRFYRELAGGATIGHAVAQGRAALRGTPARWIEYGPGGRTVELQDWFLPHLYQRGPDEPLLPRGAAQQQAPRQFDAFLSHNHNDSDRVEALARTLVDKHGLRVWLDKWEAAPGRLEPQCERGIRDSRFTVVVGSQAALNSKWVAWEIARHVELNPESDRLLPVKFEPLDLPPGLHELLWIDFTDPARDEENAALLTRYVRSADAEDARRRRGFRAPPEHGHPGAFPRSPKHFTGRARELYDLERCFRRDRGVVLHAMGGMGKTTLATEAAAWWTRSGLFRDGACFVSFERTLMTAERVVSVLGEYCEGPKFHQRPVAEQKKRAVEFMRDKAVLLVWDNYESVLPAFHGDTGAHDTPYTDQVRRELAELFQDLTTGPGKGCVLVTCRPGETGLPGARRVELHGLARADSLWLLHRILERDGASLSDPRLTREKLDPLLNDLADHPLSLELVGPHLRGLTPEQVREDFGRLVASMKQASDQDRNTSLLASLEFSRRHLSEAARAALPWLGLFSGGVFEDNLLDVSEIKPVAWAAIRAELVGIALLRIEDDINVGGRPFLRFHPTLAIASTDAALAERPETRERFMHVYLALMQALDAALQGDQSRAALEILDREEMNWRIAVRWAIADSQQHIAAYLGDTFQRYLERSGRLRERDAWVQMLHDAVIRAGFTEEAAGYEREHAWTLFTQGDPQRAVDSLQSLVERLRQTKEFDPGFQLASTMGLLGRVLHNSGDSARAIPVLQEAVGRFEGLIEQTEGRSWEQLLETSDRAKDNNELGNLSAAMGDLANALRRAGQHSKALETAERSLRIQQASGNLREVAAAHGQCARILLAAGRYDDADARYEQALDAAMRAGDKEIQAITLQHQGNLANNRNQLDRAARLYRQALQRFQEADNTHAVMQTYGLLGRAERDAGRLTEARAWYERSRELAIQLKDQSGIGFAAVNIGVICLREGEAARSRGDDFSARRHFEEAVRSVEQGRHTFEAQQSKPDEAVSLGLLARSHFLLGDFATAERHAQAARAIHESLGLIEVLRDYHTLSEIAAARGETAAAAEWARKRDEVLAEQKRRAGSDTAIPSQMLRALEALTMVCARAGFGGGGLDPSAEEALAKLDSFDAPFPDFSASLRRLAAGEIPSIPAGLPPELGDLLARITEAIRDAK